MKKIISIIMILFFLGFMIGCSAHTHIIGKGAQGMNVEESRQWYILFGLVPLNEVDTKAMAAGATDYKIETEITALDFIMNIFTGIISVNSRTVVVTK